MADPLPAIMVFDLRCHGHHPSYLLYLVRRFAQIQAPCRLDLVVAPAFPHRHPDVAAQVEAAGERFRLVPIDEAHARRLPTPRPDRWRGRLDLARSVWAQWRLIRAYGQRLGASHALIMLIDHMLQLPLALRCRQPFPVSGIYFRPTLHYPRLCPEVMTPADHRRQARQRLLVRSALGNDSLHTLFTLDPFAVDALNQLGPRPKTVYLPDPVDAQTASAADVAGLQGRLGLDPSRKTLLMFGLLKDKKGLTQTTAALMMLPAALRRRVTLLVVGEVVPEFQAPFERCLAQLRADRELRVIAETRFVSEGEVQAYFGAADLVLATYQRHVGSSGILIRAAAAGRPAIASNFGAMGALAREHGLGLTVDATRPEAIAAALGEALTKPLEQQGDIKRMAAFAASNTPETFGDCLARHMVGQVARRTTLPLSRRIDAWPGSR